MSASTVSITANTAAAAAAARRRPVMVGEKKSNSIELLPSDGLGQVNGAVNTNGDVNNSIDKGKGDTVLERSSKELVQLKRTSATTATLSPRRPRKAAAAVNKAEKPRWLTIVSVFTKNLVLLVVLLGLVQMVRRLALKVGDSGSLTGLSDFEGRIADVEALMKTTARMIQVQVEVVDKKLESEVGGLRKEINGKIEELETKSEGLEKSLNEFKMKVGDWLSKEELDKLYEELVNKGKKGGDSDVTLDDIRLYARMVVLKEIEKHAADGLGRVDYALAPGGGMVIKHSEPYHQGSNWFLMGNRKGVNSDADKMLKPSFGEPGQCFPLKGSSGFVQIRLRTAIVPEAITLEHVAKSVAYDRSSAPKNCRVSGWLQGHDYEVAVDAEKMFLLTEFTYDLEKSNAQTFNVLESAGYGIVDTVRLDFSSNHGSASHTCIYRLRVHGREPDTVSMMAMQS